MQLPVFQIALRCRINKMYARKQNQRENFNPSGILTIASSKVIEKANDILYFDAASPLRGDGFANEIKIQKENYK